jgi:hypothetical protein
MSLSDAKVAAVPEHCRDDKAQLFFTVFWVKDHTGKSATVLRKTLDDVARHGVMKMGQRDEH